MPRTPRLDQHVPRPCQSPRSARSDPGCPATRLKPQSQITRGVTVQARGTRKGPHEEHRPGNCGHLRGLLVGRNHRSIPIVLGRYLVRAGNSHRPAFLVIMQAAGVFARNRAWIRPSRNAGAASRIAVVAKKRRHQMTSDTTIALAHGPRAVHQACPVISSRTQREAKPRSPWSASNRVYSV